MRVAVGNRVEETFVQTESKPANRRRGRRVVPVTSAMVSAVALALGVASPAVAQENAEKKAPVIRLEELKIEGRVQKPEAFYILPRSNLNYEGLEREQSFLPRVRRTLEKAPLKPE